VLRACVRACGSFTIFGTFLSGMVIGFGTWGLGNLALEINPDWNVTRAAIDFRRDPIQSLKWGALISPTDPVAILSVLGSLGELKDPQLFSVIFGESVLNVRPDVDDHRRHRPPFPPPLLLSMAPTIHE
jgi:NhaP-type Na+/H+ or K+/H+ antiporter